MTHSIPIHTLVLTALLLAASPAIATTVNLSASRDNTLYEDATGSLSNGVGEFVFVGNNDSSLHRRALIAFDIAAVVPVGATINSVQLSLHMSRTQAGPEPVTLYRVLANWGEGTSDAAGREGGGASATAGDATWIHTFFPTGNWSVPGGNFAATPSAAMTISAVGTYTWGSTPEMVADVQTWLDTPTASSGWLLVGNESTNQTSKRFDSRENATAGNRPLLTVDYTVGGTSATVYESIDDRINIVLPANAVGTANFNPYDHAPSTLGQNLYYKIDDGAGNPPLIKLVEGGSGILIHF